MDDEVQPIELRNWLTQLHGGFQQDDSVVSKMRSLGTERIFPHLRDALTDPDPELRCQAALAIFYLDPIGGIDSILQLLDDPEIVVRWHTCGLLHDLGNQSAVEPLIQTMKTDPDPQVRNTAAYALGGIGDPHAVPALIETMDTDHELDELGHSASGCAATALDDILKTNHTRIKHADRLCTMQPGRRNLDLLKTEAMELYRNL